MKYNKSRALRAGTAFQSPLLEALCDSVLTMLPDELMISWYEGNKVDGASFILNSPVLILQGEFAGSRASVISLESLSPKVTYFVETSEGRATVVEEGHLESVT